MNNGSVAPSPHAPIVNRNQLLFLSFALKINYFLL